MTLNKTDVKMNQFEQIETATDMNKIKRINGKYEYVKYGSFSYNLRS